MPSNNNSNRNSSTNQGPPPRRFPFGTSFSDPHLSFSAQRNPHAEHFIVVDRARGFIRTTTGEARDFAEMGYLVFDLAGWQPTWDPPLRVPPREEIEREAFVGTQLEEVYDVEGGVEEELGRRLDGEIYYDVEEKRFKWRRIGGEEGKREGDREGDEDE